MRLLTWFLHLLIVALLFCAMGRAQTQGTRPDLIDSYQSQTLGSSALSVAYPENVQSGQLLVSCLTAVTAGYGSVPAGQTPTTYSLSDTLGNTWTTLTPIVTPVPADVTKCCTEVQLSYTVSSSSGTDTVTYSGVPTSFVPYSINVGRFQNLAGGTDGSNSATASPPSGASSISTTITTGTNGDIIVGCATQANFNSAQFAISAPTEYVSYNQEAIPQIMSFARFPVKGSSTITNYIQNGTSTVAMVAQAFKPTAIALTDTVLPDAANGIAYSAQLHGVGGTATLTYACTGLPANGLSLNTSTGVISGATPTTGSLSLGCTVTDGTLTSATDSLTLTIGAGFNTPVVRQSQAIYGNGGSGNSGTFATPVSCGNLIAVWYVGSDTHGSNGWVIPAAGANNAVQDTMGNVFQRVGPIAGPTQVPLALYVARASTSGTDTISVLSNTTAGSGLNFTMAEISGVQSVVDVGTFSTSGPQASSPFSFSDSLTTVVPNELLAMGTATGYNQLDTISYSPLSVATTTSGFYFYGQAALGFANIVSPSSYTGTATIGTGGPGNAMPSILMHAFRPALPVAACNVFTGPGEKIRRQVW